MTRVARRAARAGLALGLALVLAACGTPRRPAPEDDTVARALGPAPVAEPAAGDVLARNERFLIYLPRHDETLAQVARRFLGDDDEAWQIAEFNGLSRPQAGQPLVVPLKPVNAVGVTAEQVQSVPILCYHRFSGSVASSVGGMAGKMVVSSTNFAQQLDWLARNDYHVIRLSQLLGFLEGRKPLPKRSVVITIDDGYESVHRHALPALRKHGFPATVFVYTDFIGAGDALSWAQLQELDASGLIDVEAHSKSHRNLIERAAGETDAAYRQAIEAETRVPREQIERRLGHKVRAFAYPYGDANEAVLEALGRQPYTLGVTVNPGGNPFYAQPLMLRRTMIYGDLDLDGFKAKLQIARPIVAP